MRFFTLNNTNEEWLKIFASLETLPIFQKFVFSITSYVLKKWPCNLQNKKQKTLLTLIYCSLRFFTLDNTNEEWPKIFSSLQRLPISQICVPNNLLGPKKNDLVTSKVFVRRPCRPLYNVLWGLSHSIKRWKMVQKLFSLWKTFVWNVSFYRLLRSQRIDLINGTNFFKKVCEHF